MSALWTLVAGTTPALLWLVYFYRQDRFEPEPAGVVLKTFAYGGLATIPAALLEAPFALHLGRDVPVAASLLGAVATAFVVAPIEETFKFLAVRWTVYNTREFDEPMDGLIYAASAALGFAAVENMVYVAAHGSVVMVGRALFATLGHVLFAVPWGLALGLRRCVAGVGALTVAAGLGGGIFLHGAYDGLLFAQIPQLSAAFLLLAFPLMMGAARRAFRYATPLSQYAPVAYCGKCGNGLRAGVQFCGHCGHAVPPM